MLLPDVTEILNDPEVGGGVAFQVKRIENHRTLGSVTTTPHTFNLTGNIQPESKRTQTSTSEDMLEESIVVRAIFDFQTGVNNGVDFTGPDEIYYAGTRWRVTSVENWSDWGFSVAHATRVRG